MAKAKSKQPEPVDVLVLGDHPSAYLAGALLKEKTTLQVAHAQLPDTDAPEDRLITINPELFDLHPLLGNLKKILPATPVHGVRFLSDQADTSGEYRAKPGVILTARYSQVRDGLAKLTQSSGVNRLGDSPVEIQRVDEKGLHVRIGQQAIYPKALILAGHLPAQQRGLLGMPEAWGPDVVHRFTTVRCKIGRQYLLDAKSLMPMSLDLHGKLCWGWLLPGDGEFQLIVEQPIEKATAGSGLSLLKHWVSVLQSHQVLGPKFELPASVATMDLPLAGALAHEGVANHTLLIGPAGGFYSACGEDIYPGCWSALFAADVLKKAMKELHLQDALNPYRQKWRTTLGDYLRGPHQNLRFLLPLVYRNPTMTARLAEAILLSKSVVR